MSSRVCSEPTCPTILTDGSTRCEKHRREQRRPREQERNRRRPWRYNDVHWRRIAAQFLKHHPTCSLCGAPSKVPDHHPQSRRELVASGVEHPDSWQYLRPLCTSCHNRKSARERR